MTSAVALDLSDSLEARLQTLFDAPVSIALDDPRAEAGGLFPLEEKAVSRAVPARQREFAAGRRAARAALRALGLAPAPIPSGRDRAPVWPDGATGSITHTATICIAAVVAVPGAVRSIGLDAEDDTPLDPGLLTEICTLDERAWLTSLPAEQRGAIAKFMFSAKESAYKCQYPLTGALIDFQALEITPDFDLGLFEATFRRAVGEFAVGDRLKGRFFVADGLIVTAVELP